jgi:hypothetical protein
LIKKIKIEKNLAAAAVLCFLFFPLRLLLFQSTGGISIWGAQEHGTVEEPKPVMSGLFIHGFFNPTKKSVA